MKLPQCVFLCPNTKLCCLQQCWHQDQAFSKAATCAKHRYCQCHRQDRANKSKHAVHLLSILPLCSEIQRPLFPDKSLPILHVPSPFKAQASCKSTGGRQQTQHKALEKLQNWRSPWEISCRLWRRLQGSLAEVGMMTCTQPLQLEECWGGCTEHAGWPAACQLLTFNKLAQIRKLRLGSQTPNMYRPRYEGA